VLVSVTSLHTPHNVGRGRRPYLPSMVVWDVLYVASSLPVMCLAVSDLLRICTLRLTAAVRCVPMPMPDGTRDTRHIIVIVLLYIYM